MIQPHLTAVEKAVLIAAAAGLSVAETAARSGRSVETVKTHRRSILKKWRVRNMTHAVAVGHERGILGQAPAAGSPMANASQVGAFHAKVSALARTSGEPIDEVKAEWLLRASDMLGHRITSSAQLLELTWQQLHDLLDELELARVEAA